MAWLSLHPVVLDEDRYCYLLNLWVCNPHCVYWVVAVVDKLTDGAIVSPTDADTIDAGNIAAIVLAAGMSQRMGAENKLLLEIDGQSLLRRCVMTIKTAGIGEVVVVLGHESERTKLQVEALGVECVTNSEYESGQMSSVQCGLNALSGVSKAALICLSDQPMIAPKHLLELIQAFDNLHPDKQIVVPTYNEQRGNPVMISESVRRQVLQKAGSPGCRKFIDDNPDLVCWLPVKDSAFTTDIDTREEFQAVRDYYKNNENQGFDEKGSV